MASIIKHKQIAEHTKIGSKSTKTYFDSFDTVRRYDSTIDAIVPYYRVVHQTIIQLIGSNVKDAAGTVLDIGSGTGMEAIPILQQFPNLSIVTLDYSQAMNDELSLKLKSLSREKLDSRISMLLGDVSGLHRSSDNLLRKLPEKEQETGYIAVVSAFAIHHLSHLQKIKVYKRMYEILRKGGIFINADLFTFQDSILSKQALDIDLNYINSQLSYKNSKIIKNISQKERKYLIKRWQHHYLFEQTLEPIEEHVRILRDSGFSNVAVPFRYWQVGIFCARKDN
jgi:tRNA (cmo5U34)-methyltransferase